MQYSVRIFIALLCLFAATLGFSRETSRKSSTNECTVCNNVTYGGKIQSDETGCGSPGWDPSIITNQEFPSGGSGMMEYMWLFTTDDPTKPFTQWNQIPNSNSPNYDPGVIYKTTYYTRCSRRMGCTEFPGESNIVTKTFNCCNSLTSAGKIGSNQTGCLPSFDPFTLTNITTPSGGSGLIQYVWYKSNQNIAFDKNNSAWSLIAGATDSIYNPTPITQNTYYVRLARRTGCVDYLVSNVVAVVLFTPPTILTSAVAVKCFGESNGSIATVILGGKAPFSFQWNPNTIGNQQNPINLPAGNYQVTVTDGNGCTVVKSVTVPQPPQLAVTFTNLKNATCFGTSNGSVSANVSGGVAPYSYVWSNGATTVDLTSVSAGSYVVTATDKNGCIVVGLVTISSPASISVSISKVDNKCFGDKKGLATAFGIGGVMPFTYLWSTGQTTTSILNLASGVYTVTATDANGCTKSTAVTIGEPGALVFSVNKENVKCFGGNSGSILLNVSNGTAPYSFLWSNGSTSAAINNLTAGSYQVTVTDANGCAKTAAIAISEPSVLVLTVSKSDVKCNGENSGQATASVSGGNLPYTYKWSNGSISPTISNIGTGAYQVTVTDANGCTKTGAVVISSPTLLKLELIKTENNCNGANVGSLSAIVSGGTPSYSFSWSNGATTSSINNLTAGNYAVTVTDANGCKKTATATITEPTALLIEAAKVDVKCNGDITGAISLSVSGGTAPYTYLWSNGATSSSINNLVAGTYSGTVTDANGCKKTATATISEPTALVVEPTKVDVKCNGTNGGSISLLVSGGTSPYTYLWSNGATTATITNLVAGTYTGTVTDANGCKKVASATITEPTSLSVSVSKTDVKCNGGNAGAIVLTVSGGTAPYSYIWSNGASSSSISNLTAGNYTATVTDANGCKKTATATISEPTALLIEAAKVDVKCNGNNTGAISLSVSGGTAPYTYLWSNGATSSSINNLVAGTYSGTVTDANGCKKSATAMISEPTALVVEPTKVDVKCNGTNGGSISLLVSGGSSPYTYLWSNGATTATITNLVAGTYTGTVTDANGCKKVVSATITEPTSLSVSVSKTDVKCNGGNTGAIVLTVSGGTAPHAYIWSNGANSSSISNLTAGNYIATVTDANGCKKTATGTITEPTALLIEAAKVDVKCNGNNTGAISLFVSGGTAPYTYLWSNGATSSSINNLVAGTYSGTVTDANGCKKSATATISEPTALVVEPTKVDVKCNGTNGGSISLLVSGGTSPYTYLWSNGAATATITNLVAGTYTGTVTDANGCKKVASATITEPTSLAIVVSSVDVKCNGEKSGAAVAVVTGGVAPYAYIWSNGSTSSSIVNVGAGTYNMTVTDGNGCQKTVSTIINQASSLEIILSKTDVKCFSCSCGSATVVASGGTGPYTYLWSDGKTTAFNDKIKAGTYTVTVTDVNGCSKIGSIAIDQPTPLELTIDKVDITCSGAKNGTATMTVIGGTAPYKYLWSNGATTKVLTNLAPGVYEITVTDANNCVQYDAVEIFEPAPLEALVAKTDPKCFGASSGSIAVSVSGGTAPYAYLWNTGATTAAVGNLPAGTYNLTITDANGCKKIISETLKDAPIVVAIIDKTDVKCFGENTGSAKVIASGGSQPYSYLWSNGATTQTTGNLSVGSYNVTVTDGNGCTKVSSTVITEPNPIQLTFKAENVKCHGGNTGSIIVNATGGTSPYTYLWSNGNLTNIVNNLVAGTYVVIVTDAHLCTQKLSVTIVEPTSLVATTTKFDVKCNGGTDGSATVNASGGTLPYSYSWNTGETTPTLSNIKAGKYSVIVTDAHGCQVKVDVEIGELELLLVSITKTQLLCATSSNGTATAFATGGSAPYTYLWSNGQTTAGISNLVAGTYTVTVTDANGCTKSGFITIAAPNPVVVTLTKLDVSCYGGSDGRIEASVIGGTVPYDLLYNNGVKTSINNNLKQGIYTITVIDANKCVATASTTILEPKDLDVTTFKKDPKCNNGDDGEIKLNVNGGTPGYTFKWNTGATGSLEKNLKAGTYVISVCDANKCQKVMTVVLNNPPSLQADLTMSSPKCAGQLGSAVVSVSGGTPGYTYLWSNGGNSATNNTIPAGPFAVSITDSNGCKLVKSGTMNVPSALVCAASSITKANCTDISKYGGTDGAAKVVTTGGTGAYTYLWSNGATSDVVSGLGAGSYSVTVTDANGCTCVSTAVLKNPARLGDYVWLDNNRNGLQDNFETGKSAVVVTLSGTDSKGNSITKSTVTDSVGKYLFDGLFDGVYKVTFGLPADYKFTDSNVGANDNLDSDADVNTGMSAITTVKQGDDIKDIDAGIYRKINIGDYVWIDANTDGRQDTSESGINGIKVKLTTAGPDGLFGTSDDVMVAMQNTADKGGKPGYYLFSDVGLGNYCITFSDLPADYIFTNKNQGGNDNIDSDVDSLGTLKLTVVAGQNDDLSFDAGIHLKCNNVLFGGTIGFDQILCGQGKSAATIVSLLSPTGGSGTIEYLWLKSTVGPNYVPGDPNWLPIPNTNSPYYSPGVLNQTTYFVRCSRRAPCTDYPGETNIVTVKVEAIPVAAFEVFPNADICVGKKYLVSAVDAGVGASYDWTLGGAVPGLANTRVVNDVKWSVLGSYTAELKVTKNTCVNNKTVTVQVVGCINGNIHFGALKAKPDQGSVNLSWSTISPNEENYLFEIERSEDGRHFKGIGNVDATKTDLYEFVDTHPTPGRNYYRIKHVASNNKMVYSDIAEVLLEVAGFENFLVYPNPVQGKLFVKPLAAFSKEFSVQLVNPLGQVLQTIKRTSDTGIVEVDLTSYPSGMYLLYFNFEGYRTHTQWIIKTDE